ncbi:toxin-antitoxin system YwqK family antitoxin [Kangiella japonica]|uniref:Toxin-antitoxin system YwqK family antitoxin n=1 Tax=Kangiella japonica TaxID=647384 RepID=A0ABP3CDK4_9GAMM
MKLRAAIITAILSGITLYASTAFSAGKAFDYTKVKPEHYANLKNKSEFTDKQGDTYKVKNSKYSKGLYIQITENGRSKWKKHGRFYSISSSSGKTKGFVTYHYGVKEGPAESYNHKGQVQFKKYYKNNRLEGPWQQYTDKGKLFEERIYVGGKKHGERIMYHPNGQPNFKSTYVQGKREGESYQYNDKGKIIAKKVYVNGKQIGKTQWLH